MSPLKIIHQRANCIGCNTCAAIAPQTWVMDEKDGKANLVGGKTKGKVVVGDIFDCDEEANRMAADACPVRIIKVSK